MTTTLRTATDGDGDDDKRAVVVASTVRGMPPLVYARTDGRLAVPPVDRLLVGASYTCFAQRAWYALRASLFESNLFPYDLHADTLYVRVRHGVVLWPRMNLYSYTCLDDPDTVYVRAMRSSSSTPVFVARFHFGETCVTLTEDGSYRTPPQPRISNGGSSSSSSSI